MTVSEFMEGVHMPKPEVAVLDGMQYDNAVEFANSLIKHDNPRGQELLDALQKMKEAK